ncbi:hypothetical protein BX616_001425 [Lobosporangium transversale]|uniref:Uncharacterized protein n=1 Tax=Lobosporangium transversale TaxID=64571 RepID=A0A1Y2G875_9FUNG|nr:hypothetical protein BCR41DRAFT_390580 [Lobosporangium transversale]KAF9917299.1 hypothetical protein BX616_001425 [Lobosporangium transversale]ORY98275.1 hypothetical protein BCR41DRAFT_390580 [Lobosporangium transversale]|eukprot:XP_021875704.1 hypothetical protein BCR41DRAFT_390580 [Lobosporangium transversale]
MLKKKRFSGLFGPSMTDIPSPGPEHQMAQQQSSVSANGSGLNGSPQMLSSQGRQGSILTLGSTGGIGNFISAIGGGTVGGDSGNNGSNGIGMSQQNDEDSSGLHSLTRMEVHQSLESLKKLVIAAESYRELTTKLAKTTKQLGKCFKEYGDSKGMDNTYVMCLKSSANFYESFSEMESKLATCLQKDFELLQTTWEKHSKRVTKDDKIHDEVLGELDEKIKKISLNYDKKSKKPDPSTALMSHEKYISTLSELQDSIATAKRDHRNTVARRERYAHSMTAQIACRLSEAQFLAVERQLRGSGPSLLKIKEWAPYAGHDMPPPTLVSNGDPTIEVRGGSFEEYIARHTNNDRQQQQKQQPSLPGAYQASKSDQGPTTPVYTITEMPQITLPPFAPMQQHLQRQQQEQQQQQSMPMPMPTPKATTSNTPTNLPTSMPEHKQYIPQKQPTVMPTPMSMPTPFQTARIDKPAGSVQPVSGPAPGPMVKVASSDHKLLIREKPAITAGTPATSTIVAPTTSATTTKAIPTVVEKPTPVSTVPTAITSDTINVLTKSSPTTPGAFPDKPTTNTATTNNATNLVKEVEARTGAAVSRSEETDSKSGDRIETNMANTAAAGDGSFPEDQRSVSTKVGSTDGGSTRGERIKGEYLQELKLTHPTADDAADAVALDQFRREKLIEPYRYADDDDGDPTHYRNDLRRNRTRDDDMDGPVMSSDELYMDDPYSPISGGDQLSFYDDGDDVLSRNEPRRYYDDDESQHSGTISLQPGGGEYFASRGRYDDHPQDYDRLYHQHYSSSIPSRYSHHHSQQQQHPYLTERELDQAEWAAAQMAASETASMTGYAREQYPGPRDYPTARPTLEDRERELDMINQKASAMAGAGAARPTYARRPATAPGTVANLRRRFSDQSVSDSPPGPVASSGQGNRARGMSGSVLSIQQHQQQQQDAIRRDARFPPRSSTPQSRLVAASGYRHERGVAKGMSSGQLMGSGVGNNGRYSSAGGAGHISDYEDGGSGRVSVLVGDQRTRRR